jgi:DNA-binding transcriptional MocR family regulator
LKLYEKLADEIAEAVRRGVFAPGEKIASVRQASLQHEVSIKTVLHAYALLESRGILETRPQSGYFVRAKPLLSASPHASGGRVARRIPILSRFPGGASTSTRMPLLDGSQVGT